MDRGIRRCHHDGMRMSRLATAALVVAAAISLSACSAGSEPVITPVVKDVGDLQGTTVDLIVGQVLTINTGDLAVDSYSGAVSDTAIAEFVKGKDDGSATFNPGVTALAVGSTEVVLSNSDGGIQDVTFTVQVTE